MVNIYYCDANFIIKYLKIKAKIHKDPKFMEWVNSSRGALLFCFIVYYTETTEREAFNRASKLNIESEFESEDFPWKFVNSTLSEGSKREAITYIRNQFQMVCCRGKLSEYFYVYFCLV